MAIRGHLSIENQNHHVRHVALREDHCSTRTKPGILARLRSIALNCMRGLHQAEASPSSGTATR
jgi:predicted transposase YbfD/YdcC